MKQPTNIEVVRAIDAIMSWSSFNFGLCWAFDVAAFNNPWFVIPEILKALGGEPDKAGYFWPEKELDQRLMMLAFMLEWTK